MDRGDHALDPGDVSLRRPPVGQHHHAACERLVRAVCFELLRDLQLGVRSSGRGPIGGQRRLFAINHTHGSRQQRHPLGAHVHDARRRQHLLNRFLRRGRRRQQRLDNGRRIGICREAQRVAPRGSRGLQVRDRLVQQAEHLAHLGCTIVVVAIRPVGQRLARALNDRQPLRRRSRGRDLVQCGGDVVGKGGVVAFGLSRHVMRRPRRGRVAACAIPVDARDRQVDQVQRRVRRRCRRHREDHAIVHPRRLSVTDEGSAIGEEHALQRRLVGSRPQRSHHGSRQADSRQHASAHEVSRVVCGPKQVKLWKSCGWLVNFLWIDRHLNFFFDRAGRRNARRRLCVRFRDPLRLIAVYISVESMTP